MRALKRLWISLFPGGRRALNKRRLERLLMDVGLSRSEARGVLRDYFD